MRHALLLALFLAVPALAEDEAAPAPPAPPPPGKDGRARIIEKKDQDGDGRLSPAEFGREKEIFDRLDKNGDGFLTADELPQRGRGQRGPRGPGGQRGPRGDLGARLLERVDADGDGKISKTEWPERMKLGFEKADRNGDGFVDKAELGEALGALGRRGPREPGERGGPRRGPPSPEEVQKIAQAILKRHDKNGDGKLAGDEIPGAGARHDLSKADKNQDGAVDLFEVTAAIQARIQQHRRGGGRGFEQMLRRVQQFDADGDGNITSEEWKGPDPLFKRLDRDQDGTISTKEMKAALKQAKRWNNGPADAAFRRFDTDGDGKITSEEWKLRPDMFQRFDANGDGVITRDEITPKGPRRGKRLDVRSGKDSAHFLARFDKNRDGKVTSEEFPHATRFKEIDADGDGVLSEDEIKDAMDKVRREKAYGFFERFDLNTDGKVTREEFTGPARVFERMDKNHDGVIDKADQLPDG